MSELSAYKAQLLRQAAARDCGCHLLFHPRTVRNAMHAKVAAGVPSGRSVRKFTTKDHKELKDWRSFQLQKSLKIAKGHKWS